MKDSDYLFEGEFIHDLPTNYGKEIRKEIVYEGYFEKGFYEGKGSLVFPNGRRYEGNFKSHQFHGEGELIGDDGIVYKGEWVEGSLNFGTISYYDGSYYIGELKGSFFKHGKGEFFNADGKKLYEG